MPRTGDNGHGTAQEKEGLVLNCGLGLRLILRRSKFSMDDRKDSR